MTILWKVDVQGVVDLAGHRAAYVVFAPLRDDAPFRGAAVGDWGWSVHWSAGMEISPDTLWQLSFEQRVAWLRA